MQRNAAKRQTPSQGWRNIVKNCLENFRVGYNESLQMVLCGKPGGKTKQWTVKTTNLWRSVAIWAMTCYSETNNPCPAMSQSLNLAFKHIPLLFHHAMCWYPHALQQELLMAPGMNSRPMKQATGILCLLFHKFMKPTGDARQSRCPTTFSNIWRAILCVDQDWQLTYAQALHAWVITFWISYQAHWTSLLKKPARAHGLIGNRNEHM